MTSITPQFAEGIANIVRTEMAQGSGALPAASDLARIANSNFDRDAAIGAKLNNLQLAGAVYPEIEKLADLLEAARRINVAPKPFVLSEDIDVADLQTLAEARALEKAQDQALTFAREEIVSTLLNRLDLAVTMAVPVAVQKFRPVFNAAVESYVDAVNRLPNPLTADAVLEAGTDALNALSDAAAAADVIRRGYRLVIGTKKVNDRGRLLVMFDPADVGQYHALVTEARKDTTDGTTTPGIIRQVGGSALVYAARNGVKIRLDEAKNPDVADIFTTMSPIGFNL